MSSDDTEHQHTPDEEREIREAALDQTIEGSIPASDPPSSNPNPDDHSGARTSASQRGEDEHGSHESAQIRPENYLRPVVVRETEAASG